MASVRVSAALLGEVFAGAMGPTALHNRATGKVKGSVRSHAATGKNKGRPVGKRTTKHQMILDRWQELCERETLTPEEQRERDILTDRLSRRARQANPDPDAGSNLPMEHSVRYGKRFGVILEREIVPLEVSQYYAPLRTRANGRKVRGKAMGRPRSNRPELWEDKNGIIRSARKRTAKQATKPHHVSRLWVRTDKQGIVQGVTCYPGNHEPVMVSVPVNQTVLFPCTQPVARLYGTGLTNKGDIAWNKYLLQVAKQDEQAALIESVRNGAGMGDHSPVCNRIVRIATDCSAPIVRKGLGEYVRHVPRKLCPGDASGSIIPQATAKRTMASRPILAEQRASMPKAIAHLARDGKIDLAPAMYKLWSAGFSDGYGS